MSDNSTGGSDIVKQFLAWGIFPAPCDVEENVKNVRSRHPKKDREALIEDLVDRSKKLCAAQGVVASLPGAIPGLGTAAQIGLMVGSAAPETVLLLRKMAHLQMSIAHLRDYEIRDEIDPSKVHSDRIEEFAVVMGIMTGAIIPAKEAAKKYGSKFATVQISRHLSPSVLRAINKRVGFTLLTKFGTKRGGVALGRVIPLGVGAAIGGGMNYHSMHQFSKSACKFYSSSGDDYVIPE